MNSVLYLDNGLIALGCFMGIMGAVMLGVNLKMWHELRKKDKDLK